MNKISTLLLIIIAALSIMLVTTIQTKASNKAFESIIPFTTTSERLGFFDQSNGRIYMYDSNFSQCVFQGQMKALGQPIQAK